MLTKCRLSQQIWCWKNWVDVEVDFRGWIFFGFKHNG